MKLIETTEGSLLTAGWTLSVCDCSANVRFFLEVFFLEKIHKYPSVSVIFPNASEVCVGGSLA